MKRRQRQLLRRQLRQQSRRQTMFRQSICAMTLGAAIELTMLLGGQQRRSKAQNVTSALEHHRRLVGKHNSASDCLRKWI